MLKYAVIGLGRFGATLARKLGEFGVEVIAIDIDEASVAAVRDSVSVALRMDGTDGRALAAQGVDRVDVAVVGIGEDFEANQLATVVLRRLGVKRVVAKASSDLEVTILRRIGAHDVVSPEQESAVRLAQRLVAPRILDYLELSEDYSLVQMAAPAGFCGKTIRELDVRNVYHVNIVAIRKRKETGRDESGEPVYESHMVNVPRPTDVIDADDVLVVIGKDDDLSRLAS